MTILILNALLPVAFTIFLGWLSGRLGYLKKEQADVFAVFVLRFALPFSLFLGAVRTTPDQLSNLPFVLTLVLGLMGTFFIALLIGLYLFRHDLKTSTIQALVCAFPDMAYFGAPVLAAVAGQEGFLAVLVGNIIVTMFMLPLTVILLHIGESEDGKMNLPELKHAIGGSLKSAITNPIVWLPLLGVALSVAHVTLPGPLMECAKMTANAAGGASLFALGLMFYGERVRFNREIATNIALKNFIQPALMLLGILFTGLHGMPANQVLITGAVPTATAASMFALKSRIYTVEATSTIFLSTLLGIVTEALLIIVVMH